MARPFVFAALCQRAHPLKHSLAESEKQGKILRQPKNSLAGVTRQPRYHCTQFTIMRRMYHVQTKRFDTHSEMIKCVTTKSYKCLNVIERSGFCTTFPCRQFIYIQFHTKKNHIHDKTNYTLDLHFCTLYICIIRGLFRK